MIQVFCRRCEVELNEPGAVVLSAPRGEVCFESHLCRSCGDALSEWMDEGVR